MRPQEVERMTSKNINLETNEIHLQASITKTKKSRLFVMEKNLIEWIKSADKDKPLISPNHRKLCDAALKNLKVEWIADGLRHTFSTYHYGKYKHLEELRHGMGNSPTVIEKFYKGVISVTEVEKFWSMTPATLNKTHSIA
jgi:integrase